MILSRKSIGYITLACAGWVPFSSCTWRQAGCAAGGIAAMTAAMALLHSTKSFSDGEKAALIACATAVGCILGSELIGGTAEYISIKRAEYRAEAEQLRSNIAHIQESMSEMDNQLAWLENQASNLKSAANQVNGLTVGQDMMKAEFKKAVNKRIQDTKTIETNLTAARNDAQFLLSQTTDHEQKELIEQQIIEINKRIAATRQVRDSILEADASITYA